MAKPYIPKVFVTVRREFDGHVECEQTISLIGGAGYYLEQTVRNAINLATMTSKGLPQPTPESNGD